MTDVPEKFNVPDGRMSVDLRRVAAQLALTWRKSPVAIIGAAIVLFWVLVALLAPLISPYDPLQIHYAELSDPYPSARHWLGVDPKGRDILSRIIYGAQVVLLIAPAAVFSAYVVGTAMGTSAAYFGGWVDIIISRIADVILSFPILVLYILLITTIGASALNIILAVTIATSPAICRLTRGLILELKSNDYVAAAQLRGESALYIMFVELLPNARGPLLLDACVRIGWTILTIGALGFIGLGLPPPTPDWGGMTREASRVLLIWPFMSIFPAVALVSLVVGFNLCADGLREITSSR